MSDIAETSPCGNSPLSGLNPVRHRRALQYQSFAEGETPENAKRGTSPGTEVSASLLQALAVEPPLIGQDCAAHIFTPKFRDGIEGIGQSLRNCECVRPAMCCGAF